MRVRFITWPHGVIVAKRSVKIITTGTRYISEVEVVCDRYNWICHAFCLMSNHYYLLIETTDANLSKGMRQLNGVYTQTYNRAHARVGHVSPVIHRA